MTAKLRLGWVLLAAGAGCSATTGASAFVGAVESENITTVNADGGDAPLIFSLRAQFLSGSEWPACSSDSVAQETPCCFAAGTNTVPSLSAGDLAFAGSVMDANGATSVVPLSLPFNAYAGSYDVETPNDHRWFVTTLSAPGDVVPAFSVNVGPLTTPPPPGPVLTPDITQLTALSTSQEWTVPLTPSNLGLVFRDRVILEVDGVGTIFCQAADEGRALDPPLVVPAALLANFVGRVGTVSIYRDAYTGFADAGALLVGLRSGVGIRTLPGAVSFTL